MARRDIIVIGTSAGGVEALKELVSKLPSTLPASIFIVLHTLAQGPSLLPDILGKVAHLPVVRARNGVPIKRGQIYVAPPDYHLLVKRGYMTLGHGPRENRHRPAVDPLFRTAARAYGNRVIGVILTGMLDDGTVGLLEIKQHGGVAIAQDPTDAMYPGMPQSAVDSVDCDHIVPLADVAPLLSRLAHESLDETGEARDAQYVTDVAEMDMMGEDEDKLSGNPSPFVCPECGGVLWENHNGEVPHYRCRTGHAYSVQSLVAAQSETVESSLWAALRTLEESASLSRRAADHTRGHDHDRAADRFDAQAHQIEKQIDMLRKMLVDIRLPSAEFLSETDETAYGD